ncbi:MAG: DUF5334 family protein [Cyanobacteriota bacterium]
MVILANNPLFAWDGYEPVTGDYVDIDTHDIKKSNIIDYYDHFTGDYNTGIVEFVQKKKNVTRVEIFDLDSNSYRNFDMDNSKNNRKLLDENYKY